jgi:glutathione S-transferase
MKDNTLKLYQSAGSPNSRRVRIFLAEKGLEIPLIPVDLGKGEQHTEAYRAINLRRVVPTLVLQDGTAIGEVSAILRYLEEIYPQSALHGETAKARALTTMWERRVEQEGFASVMEAIRNSAPGLKGRAIAGPHDYDQIDDSTVLLQARHSAVRAGLRQYDAPAGSLLPPPLARTCPNHGLERATEGRLVREPRLLGHFRQCTAGV